MSMNKILYKTAEKIRYTEEIIGRNCWNSSWVTANKDSRLLRLLYSNSYHSHNSSRMWPSWTYPNKTFLISHNYIFFICYNRDLLIYKQKS